MADSIAQIILRLKDEASAQLRDVGSAAKAAGDDLSDLGKSGAAETFERTGQAAAKLGGAVDLVNPTLGVHTRSLADIADVGELAVSSLKSLGLGMGSILAIAGPLTIAVAGLALTQKLLADEVARTEAEMAQAAETARDWQDAHEQLAKVSNDVQLAFEEETGQLSKLEAAWMRSDDRVRAGYAEQLRLQREAVDATKAEIEVLREKIKVSQENAGGGTGAHQAMVDKEAALSARLPAQEAQLAATADREQTDLGLARSTIAIQNAKKLAAEEAAEAERRHAAAVAERAAAEAKADAEWKASDSYAAFLYDTSDYLSTGASAVVGEARRAAAELDAYLASVEAARAGTEAWAAEATAEMAEVVAELDALEAQMAAAYAAQLAQRAGAINTAASLGGSAMSGDVAGLISSVAPMIGTAVGGPVGAAAASAIGDALNALSTLGNEGAEAVLARIDGYVGGLVRSVEELPQLVESIPGQLRADAIPKATEALAKIAPAVGYELTKAAMLWPVWFVEGMIKGLGAWWSDIGGLSGIGTSIRDGVRAWWTETWSDVKSWLEGVLRPGREDGEKGAVGRGMEKAGQALKNGWEGLWNGSFDVGTDYVARDGLAAVHRGERIERANGTSSGRGAVLDRASGGGGIQVVLNTMVAPPAQQVEDLVREVARQTGRGLG